MNVLPNYDTVRELLKLLSHTRADSYSTWIETGWTLYNIDPNLLEAFKEFSRKSDKYDEQTCERVWNAWSKHKATDIISIASLHYWAQLDNPTEYLNICKNKFDLS